MFFFVGLVAVVICNPEPHLDTIFDNIDYKTEIYLNNVDVPNQTITNMQLFNEYQNSGLVPIIIGRNGNTRRRFRDWNTQLPREAGTRNRIRNPWVFLKLQLNNPNSYKMILHDILISYTI